MMRTSSPVSLFVNRSPGESVGLSSTKPRSCSSFVSRFTPHEGFVLGIALRRISASRASAASAVASWWVIRPSMLSGSIRLCGSTHVGSSSRNCRVASRARASAAARRAPAPECLAHVRLGDGSRAVPRPILAEVELAQRIARLAGVFVGEAPNIAIYLVGQALDLIAYGNGAISDRGALFVRGNERGFVRPASRAPRVRRASMASRSGRSSSELPQAEESQEERALAVRVTRERTVERQKVRVASW